MCEQSTTAHEPDDHPMTPDLATTAAEWDAAAALARASYTERAALMLAGVIPDAPPRPCYVCARPATHTIAGRRYCAECAPLSPPPAVTAQMLADIWQDEHGPQRVARLLARLPEGERNRLCVDYWLMLRRARQDRLIKLRDVHIQFCLVEMAA